MPLLVWILIFSFLGSVVCLIGGISLLLKENWAAQFFLLVLGILVIWGVEQVLG